MCIACKILIRALKKSKCGKEKEVFMEGVDDIEILNKVVRKGTHVPNICKTWSKNNNGVHMPCI